jgi:hypothetical protein
MDSTTDGVTLHSVFILKVVEPFRGMERLCAPLFEMVSGLDHVDPRAPAPIQLYNDVCAWIEQHLGAASVRAAGQSIGQNAFNRMRRERMLQADCGPAEALTALSRTVLSTIQDPKKRGWDVLEIAEGYVLMRRTQTFNCVMQEGVLLAMVEATGVTLPRVEHLRCTRRGDEYCEYEVRWLPKRK